MGAVLFTPTRDDIIDVMDRADKAMYEGKKEGRNQLVLYKGNKRL